MNSGATMWPRLQGSNTIPGVTQERLKYLEEIEMQFYNLEAEHNGLKKEFQNLEEKLQTEREELKRLQAMDFAKGKKDNSRSHDNISQSLDEIFSKSVDWAREYFKIDLKDFKIDKFEQFKRELELVMWDDCNFRAKKFLNVSHLVQAVVADRLVMEFFFNPFDGCEQGFRRHCGGLYRVMSEENIGEAYRWRAMTLSAYERSGKWPPPTSSSPSPAYSSVSTPSSSRPGSRSTNIQTITWYRDQHYDRVVQKIENSVRPIARKYFPERNDEERLRKCKEFVRAAGELGAELGKHAACLEVFDKFWFQGKLARAFTCGDRRMKDRFCEEDINPGESMIMDIVLRPCLMKYGNDKGEDYDKSSVWIPALVDLKRPPRPGF